MEKGPKASWPTLSPAASRKRGISKEFDLHSPGKEKKKIKSMKF